MTARLCNWLWLLLPLWLLAVAPALAQTPADTRAIGREAPWPRIVPAPDAALTVYPPQLDDWNGHALRARLAVRARSHGKAGRAYYGVIAVAADTLVDKGRRVVNVERVKITAADFPAATPAQAQAWGQALAQDFENRAGAIALDRLEAALAVGAGTGNTMLRNTPPRIVFSTVPALLVYIDGAPAWRRVAGTPYERVVNTRPLLLREGPSAYYLKVFDGWLGARALTGPWRALPAPAPALDAVFEKLQRARLVDPLKGQITPEQKAPTLAKTVPALHVATVPTELIVIDGEPDYAQIAGTDLQYVANTTGHVFRDAGDNKFYVLLSGRWFRANAEKGPWEFVLADRLPADFARIPDSSPKENVKASVAGTAQAREAAVAARLPQLAQLRIGAVPALAPQFDGDPDFRKIDGTDLEYAANTATPVIRTGAQGLFALENGVWFTAASARGPWTVAGDVPAAIYSIPPSAPLYYVTFAHVYAAAGDTVTVGYTPGYLGEIVDPASGVVVFGTGYRYAPWIGAAWYGQPCTYGLGAAATYTPWTGWTMAFGFGWSWSAATSAAGWGWGAYPWWAPLGWGWSWGAPAYPWSPAWARPARTAPSPGGWAAYSGNLYQNWGGRAATARSGAGYNAWSGNAWAGRVGLSYNSRSGVAAAGQRGAVRNVYAGARVAGSDGDAARSGAMFNREGGAAAPFAAQASAAGGARHGEDLYAGRGGNVYRRTDGGIWQQHTADGWQPLAEVVSDARAPARAAPVQWRGDAQLQQQRGELKRLDRDNLARAAGGERAQNLRNASMDMQRSFGDFHGGIRGR